VAEQRPQHISTTESAVFTVLLTAAASAVGPLHHTLRGDDGDRRIERDEGEKDRRAIFSDILKLAREVSTFKAAHAIDDQRV
jgi:hypothetical protein